MNHKQPESTTSTNPIQAVIFRLVCGCPAIEQSDCVLKEVRLLPVRERYDWVKTLADEQLEEIYHAHQQCLLRQRHTNPLRFIHTKSID